MPSLDPTVVKALILDVDGTLYRQTPVRVAIVWRLLKTYLTRPAEGASTLRALRAYRNAQDVLRFSQDAVPGDLATAQVLLASKMTGENSAFVAACAARWMQQEPLDLVARARHTGLPAFLRAAKARRLRLGVFSDYPAVSKLRAMEIASFFDVIVSAQDPEVQRFKPSPRGLEVTLHRLGVSPNEAIYLGDRPELDALAAGLAGIPCVIIGRRRTLVAERVWVAIRGYKELGDVLGCN